MASTRKIPRTVPSSVQSDERSFPWLEYALAVSVAAMFFQLFPAAWSSLTAVAAGAFSYIDVRGWTWKSYAVVCVITLSILIILKGRQESN